MGISKGTVLTVVIAALVMVGLTWLIGPWVALGIVLGLIALLAILTLVAAKTGPGRRAAGVVGRRVGRTRVGRRLARAQIRAEAKRKGIATTDPFGRPLSDIELQLELVDTPETRAIKRQLRNLNPQQRAQALRMLERQAEEAQRTGQTPQAVQMKQPRPSGRPVTRPPRSRGKRKR